MTEWLKVHDWNSCVGQLTGGSNPPLSATLRSIAAGEGRGPATVSREPRQAGNGATVASDSGRRSPRLSPARWIILGALLGPFSGACTNKIPPEPLGLTDACPPGAAVHDTVRESACLLDDGTRHGRTVRKGPSGRVVEEIRYRDGQRHGDYHRLRDDGSLEVAGGYVDGLRDGAWQWWWPDGTPQTVGAYAEGVEVGEWTTYWPTGIPQAEGEMVDGARHGPWTFWHHQRQVAAEGVFALGERVGAWSFFDPQGEPVDAATYDERWAL